MYENSIKTEIVNNVMVTMAAYLEQSVMTVLEQTIQQQLVRVNLEEITTLPAESKNGVDKRNEDIMDQVDWQTGDVMILGEKSDRYRTLYLDDDARHYYRVYLESRPGESQWLFPGTRKPYGKIGTESLRDVFKAVGERAGIKSRVYPHKMRKTLGMSLKNKGVDIGTISEIMGHAGSEVTSRYYAQSTPDTLRAVRKRAAGF